MGAMKQLLADAEYVFTGGEELWERWKEADDHGLLVYAFSGGRWAFSDSVYETKQFNSLHNPYFVGGEGFEGDSPVICEVCAMDLIEVISGALPESGLISLTMEKNGVWIRQLEVERDYSELKECPCSNFLFNLVHPDDLFDACHAGTMSEAVYAHWLMAQGSALRALDGADFGLNPEFQSESKG